MGSVSCAKLKKEGKVVIENARIIIYEWRGADRLFYFRVLKYGDKHVLARKINKLDINSYINI